MKYSELVEYLFSIKDTKFADFSKTLSNSEYISIGVKNPVLRQIIKNLVNDEEMKLSDFELGKYLEVDFIYFGLSLSRLKTSEEQLSFIEDKIHLAKSWAITDCVTTFLKKFSFEQFWNLFIKLHKSKYIYDRRMAYVLGLKQYKDKQSLKILNHINLNEEYMVMMGEAWLLATMAIIYPQEIFDFLKDCDDTVLKRKTISKISDSFRFDDATKSKFKSLR